MVKVILFSKIYWVVLRFCGFFARWCSFAKKSNMRRANCELSHTVWKVRERL